MRRDDQAGQLLVGIVGQREDDPRRLRAGLERAHFDAPHDAVGAGRGRDLNAVALGAVMFDGPSEIDRVGIGRDPDGLHRERRSTSREDEREQDPDPHEGRQNAATSAPASRAGSAIRDEGV